MPRYLTEPPSEDPPALVAGLLEESAEKVKGEAFTATIFDLMRRRQIDSIMTSTDKARWGGLRKEPVSDLALKLTPRNDDKLKPYEREVIETIGRATQLSAREHGRLLLTDLKNTMNEDPKYFSTRYKKFRTGVRSMLKKRGWWVPADRKLGRRVAWWLFLLAGLALGASI